MLALSELGGGSLRDIVNCALVGRLEWAFSIRRLRVVGNDIAPERA